MTWAKRVKCVVEKRRDVRSLDRYSPKTQSRAMSRVPATRKIRTENQKQQ